MALPYLLTLYQLHLQFARTVDMEKLQSALIDVERHLDTLESVLENKLQRAVTMLQNAYGEGKQVSARIRASAQSVQMTEVTTDTSPLAQGSAPGNGSGGVAEISTMPLELALIDSAQ
jgi:superfamily II RNA helicase